MATCSTAVAHARVFVDSGNIAHYNPSNIVEVESTWEQIREHLLAHSIAMIIAPPKSGKSMLGMLAEADLVPSMKDFEVRYVSNLNYIDSYLSGWKLNNLHEAATEAKASILDKCKKTILYFFDEAHDISDVVLDQFIKHPVCYAVFATSGTAAKEGYVTPAELIEKSFFYSGPANVVNLRNWLLGRFEVLFGKGKEDQDVILSTDLLLNVSSGHIGMIQTFGCRLEDEKCTSFSAVRQQLRADLLRHDFLQSHARCFGTHNGTLTPEQASIVSMIRCSGRSMYMDEHGTPCWHPFDMRNKSERVGLSKALYAFDIEAAAPGRLSKLVHHEGSNPMHLTYVHPLQPEHFELKFTVDTAWKKLSMKERWVTNFSHEPSEPCSQPANVVDLLMSWVSNISTLDLIAASRHNRDAPESTFQQSFRDFCNTLAIDGDINLPVKYDEDTGIVDFLGKDFGVEFLISKVNKLREGEDVLKLGSQTYYYLKNHIARSDGAAAKRLRVSSYGKTAQDYRPGCFATVLISTVTDIDKEWVDFNEGIKKLSENEPDLLRYEILAVLATAGWSFFDVFLQKPGNGPTRFRIPRQKLLLKIVGGKVEQARFFHPKPELVWVNELAGPNELSMKDLSAAFEIDPAPDTISKLRQAILAKCAPNLPPTKIKIYTQGHSKMWKLVADPSTVLFANTCTSPYGYLIEQ